MGLVLWIRLMTVLLVTASTLSPASAGLLDRRVLSISVDKEPTEIRTLGGGRVEAELVTMMVPENRSRRQSAPLAVRFIRVPARNPSGLPPLMVLADGAAIEAARGASWPVFRALSEVADIVLVDPRGMGASDKPLDCQTRIDWNDKIVDRATLVDVHRSAFDRCEKYWKALGADLRGFTLRENADDLAAIIDTLGGQVSVLASGSGSQLAFALLKYHPKRVERVVMTGVTGLDQNVRYPEHTAKYFERLQRIIDADRETLNRFPRIDAAVEKLADRLDKDPETIEAIDLNGQSLGERTISGYFVRRVVAEAIRNPAQLRAMLEGLWQAEQNYDYSYFSRWVPVVAPDTMTLEAATTLTMLSQGASGNRLRRYRGQARRATLLDAGQFPLPHLLKEGRLYRVRESHRKRPNGSVPLLVFSGTLDGITAPAAMRKATRGLKSQRVVVTVNNGGHDVFFDNAEIVPTIRRFVQREPLVDQALQARALNVAPLPPRVRRPTTPEADDT